MAHIGTVQVEVEPKLVVTDAMRAAVAADYCQRAGHDWAIVYKWQCEFPDALICERCGVRCAVVEPS